MVRNTRGLLSTVLTTTLVVSCSFFTEDEKNDEEQGTGGAQLESTGGMPFTGGAGATVSSVGGTANTGNVPNNTGADNGVAACESLEGLDDACVTNAHLAENLETNILLAMDKSGSMNNVPEGFGVSKWEALKTALSTALGEAQNRISFGIELFPTTAEVAPIPEDCHPRCCEMPAHAEMNVPITPGSQGVTSILSLLNQTAPGGGTPTAVALARAHAYFANGAGVQLTGQRYVLLATDGGPNCNPNLACEIDQCTSHIDEAPGCPPPAIAEYSCCATNSEGCLDAADTLLRIKELGELGVQTIVVGIPGSEAYRNNLDDFAWEGGAPQEDAATNYYEVAASGGVQALTDTFVRITRKLVNNCEIAVPEPPPGQPLALNKVNVAIDCATLPQKNEADDSSNWQFVFDDTGKPIFVTILGPHCERIQAEGVERIDTIFGCLTRVY